LRRSSTSSPALEDPLHPRQQALGEAGDRDVQFGEAFADHPLRGEEAAGAERQRREPPLAVALLHQAKVVGNPSSRIE